jgi:hypothetical protein
MWEPRRLTTLWASTACYRDSFTFTLIWDLYEFFHCTLVILGLAGVEKYSPSLN